MRKYLFGIILLGGILMILSVANLFEILHSKHRANEAFKNIAEQYDAIRILKNSESSDLSSQDQFDHLERFNREIEINTVFLNASNNRLQVRNLFLLLSIVILCALVLKVYFIDKPKIGN